MEAWILAAIAGWCPTGWPRWWPWWRRRWWWPIPVPPPPEPGPRPDEGPLPDPWAEGPLPEPWAPIIDGLFGAAGGVAAWAVLGGRFGDGGMLSVITISFLGGCVGLSLSETVGGLRSRRAAARRG